jgi:hypothetical protein
LIVTEDTGNGSFFSSIISFFFDTKLRPKALENEKETFFAIAKIPLNNENSLHQQMLLTLYSTLLKTNLECPRFGPHWESIGFQGNDPATDLRGVGMLGLLQHLYFINTYPEISYIVYQISRDTLQVS